MADNVSITEGSGKTIASDEVAGVNYQQVKLTDGTLESTTGIYAGAGVSTNAMRVTMASDSASAAVHLLSTGGTINVALKPGTIAVMLDPGHLLGAVTGSGTFGVYLDSTAGTVNVQLKPGTIAVQLDPGHLLGSVTSNAGTGTMTVAFDPGHELGSIKGSNSSIAVFFDRGNPNVLANAGTGSFNVQFDPGHTLGKVDAGLGTFNVQLDPGHTLGNIATLGSITNTVAVFFSPANPSVSATFSSASMEVVPTTGSRKTMDDAHAAQRVLIVGSQTAASLTINGSVTANAGTGTMTVKFDPGNTLGKVDQGLKGTSSWLTDSQHTASIFTVSGSTSGVSVSGVNLVPPSASYNFKVYAYSLTTTGVSGIVAKFVNGAGAGQTEFWRVSLQAPSGVSTGANFGVQPPGFLFATGTNTSLNLLLDSGSLVHYSISYIKESA